MMDLIFLGVKQCDAIFKVRITTSVFYEKIRQSSATLYIAYGVRIICRVSITSGET